MAHTRKTVDVSMIKAQVNQMIAALGSTVEGRRALGALLSTLLHETGNYQGFKYLGWTKEGGLERWQDDGEPTDKTPYLGDRTRVEYY